MRLRTEAGDSGRALPQAHLDSISGVLKPEKIALVRTFQRQTKPLITNIPSVSTDVVIPRHHRRVDAGRGAEEFGGSDDVLLTPPVHILRPTRNCLKC